MRRVSLSASWVFLADNTAARTTAVSLLNLLFLLLHIWQQPFGDPLHNHAETVSLLTLLVGAAGPLSSCCAADDGSGPAGADRCWCSWRRPSPTTRGAP
jgi:hypothetical protein